MAYTHLEAGERLEVSEHSYSHSGSPDISFFVGKPLNELQRLEQESIAKEEVIYSRVLDVVQEWIQQAGRTLDLRKAQEYVNVRPIEHTSNQWAIDQYNWHEISNMVYKMTYRFSETTVRSSHERPRPTCWELSWHLTYNTINNPDYSGSGRQIAGQRDKKFSDKASMEKYLRGRIAAYAHLFTEISPPIPKEAQSRFCVNGILLPGYTVETPVTTRPDPNTVDDLLSYLDDDDMSVFFQPEKQEPPVEALSPKPPSKKVPSHKHRNTAPIR